MPFEEASSELLEGIRVKAGCILDVGTGSGKAAFMALKVMGDAGCVIGIDVSKRMVERPHLRRVEEDFTRSPSSEEAASTYRSGTKYLAPSLATSVWHTSGIPSPHCMR